MLKIYLKLLLQKLLGFDNYLYIFSLFAIRRQSFHFREDDFDSFLKLIPENGIVLDIGSNIGITGVPIGKRVSEGKVFCFEPIPRLVDTLKKVARHFHLNHIEIFETALGNENGEITMVMPDFYKVKFQGFSHVVEKESDRKKGELFHVQIRRLDDIPVIKNLTVIHAIKIDVENFEYQVLKGAEGMILKHRPVLFCELWDDEKRLRTLNYLENELGYRVKVFNNHQWEDFSGQQVSNFLFIHGSVVDTITQISG
jgi:FkbM family methyltransferase